MIPGIDVSAFQPTIDWKQVADSGVKWMYAKASEGATYVDKMFGSHCAGSFNNGVMRGAYHFLRPEHSGLDQADHFIGTAYENRTLELPPMLDLEVHDGELNDTIIQCALTWLERVKNLTGRNPIVYTGPYFFNSLGNPESFKDYPLWVAHYDTEHPMVPKPWDYFTMWQYTGNGRCPGIPGDCDMDWFNGDLEQLKRL